MVREHHRPRVLPTQCCGAHRPRLSGLAQEEAMKMVEAHLARRLVG